MLTKFYIVNDRQNIILSLFVYGKNALVCFLFWKKNETCTPITDIVRFFTWHVVPPQMSLDTWNSNGEIAL